MRRDEEKSMTGLTVWVCNRQRDVKLPDGSIGPQSWPCRDKKGEFTRMWCVGPKYDNTGPIKVSYIPDFEYVRSATRNEAGNAVAQNREGDE